MSGAPQGPSRRRKILIVEDDPSVRALVVRGLRERYDVHEAADGLAALELIAAELDPDLIILDVMMPRVDGLTFAKKFRADKRYRSIPIIFLTAKGTAADMIAGIQAGAKHYVTKPFSLATLVAKV